MIGLFGLVAALGLAVQDGQRAVTFQQTDGEWTVVGDAGLGVCLMRFPEHYNGSALTVFAHGSRNAYDFALSNPAWSSLETGDVELQAILLDSAGDIRDIWTLDAAGTAEEDGGPRINWRILRAANDGAQFDQQLREATTIWFGHEGVPFAQFDLSGSNNAFGMLDACRSHLRTDPSFDPFAG
ncbi:hypothetical protein QQS45_00085 [Alteriqipengyuania flavescens]|uniref:hypothetical protein n=1 Tax=Alteriqipengyuania flavescens TaxID=3053610 RepID=UPI0025B3690A|nr:hypothetical protein [Alteriqipengyuania flavescens]WJY18688.1 hypothetical protein QQW98_00085 [Alteriqipengyuania flavescens]WJY24628.1 hypothetical protein QQS45_00085 [Alteriqipengyuania flavescens]